MSAATDDPTRLYDRVTEAWAYLLGDDLHYGYFEGAQDALATATAGLSRRMVDAARLTSPGLSVLDVGCGTGMAAVMLAEGHRCRVTGISPSESCLAAARRRADSHGISAQVVFENRDGMDNGYGDASFDRVWIMESSHLMPDVDALIRESARVLKPGGRLVLCDIIVHRELPIALVVQKAREFDLLRRVFGRAHMKSLAHYRSLAEKHGLTVELAEDISEQTRPTFARWKDNAGRCRREVEACVGHQYWADFVASCDVLDAFWGERTLGYGLFAASK